MSNNLKIIAFVIILLTLVNANILIDGIGESKAFQEYTKLAVYMTKRYISSKTNTLIIIEKCDATCIKYKKYNKILLENFVNNLDETISVQLYVGKHGDKPWDYNLFIVDSYLAYEALRYSFPTTQQERLFYFFILLTWTSRDQAEDYRTMHRIFMLSLYFNVRNAVIMKRSATTDTIHFYTYEIFAPDHCEEKITVHEINRYENGKLQNDYLFTDHILNFDGCSLNVTAHIVEPLLSFNGDIHNETHLRDMTRLGGVEGDILKVVARLLNFKFRLRFPKGLNIIKNFGNSSGCFGDLEQNRAQLAIGGFSTLTPNGEKFTYSFVYHSTPYVFVIRSGLCFGPFKQLLNPLHIKTWILILIVFIVAMITIKIIENLRNPVIRNFIFGPKNKNPLRNLGVMFLGNPIPAHKIPKRNFARFLIMAWLMLTFEIRNGYQGKMFDSLRFSRRIPVPVKISHLIDLDFIFLTPTHSNIYPHNKTYIMYNATRRLELIQSSDLSFTTTALLDVLSHYNYKNFNTSTLAYVDEAIYSYPCVIYFHKHSILKASIDRKLKTISDAGITSYIAKQHVHSYLLTVNARSQFDGRLTNKSLQGLHYIWVLMCVIAVFVFLLELLSRKSKKLKVIMDWLN